MLAKSNVGKIKTVLPFLAVISLSYYWLPSPIMLLVMVPVVCFILAILYGVNNSFNVIYPIFVIILFIPLIFTFFDQIDVLFFAVAYGVISLIGNFIGMIFFKRNMRIKFLAKISRYLIITVIGCYVLSVIISAFMMSQMIQITDNATAYGVTIREDVIDFKEKIASRNYYDFNGELRKNEETAISTAELIKIKLVCSVSLFPIWQEYYYNPGIMDGDQYSIHRVYEKNESAIYGSNAYPVTYPFVFYVINKLKYS